jgi:hypothetical protein
VDDNPGYMGGLARGVHHIVIAVVRRNGRIAFPTDGSHYALHSMACFKLNDTRLLQGMKMKPFCQL